MMGQKIEDIVINRGDVKVRKKHAPPDYPHETKKAYKRKPKYQDEEIEEGLDLYYDEEPETLNDIMEG